MTVFTRVKKTRAQAAVEYMTAFTLVLFVFLIVQAMAITMKNNAAEERTIAFARALAQEVGQAIFVVSATPGTRLLVLLPVGLSEQGLPYTLRVTNETASVEWTSSNLRRSALAPVRVPEVRNASGATSFNITSSGNYFINNTEGVVWIVKAFD